MRYAIFADVHANETALRAVLADAADAGAERILCLGDVLGYGPDPVSTLELIHRRAHVCLAGNHDDAVSGRFPVEDFTSFAAAAVERHRAALSQRALDWLRTLPHTCEFSGPDGHTRGGFACVHGEFSDPKRFDYVLEARDAMPSWLERAEQLLFVGHTHKPGIFVLGASGEPHELEPMDFVLEEGKRYLVNVGSVGYPRSGACRSCYCVYDDVERTVSFRSIPFDLEGYRVKMNGQGLDEAPWMIAREAERRRPEVRGGEQFGKSEPMQTGKKVQLRTAGGCVPQAVQHRESWHGLSVACVLGALILGSAVVWGVVRLVQAYAERPTPHEEVPVAVAEDEVAEAVSDAAPTTALGPVVERRRCTVPVGTRLRYLVRLRKGSAPVWVHVRFEDANGEPAGDGLWFQNVRQSKRSPKAGLVPPPRATAAFLEIVKAHEGDVCEVLEIALESAKETTK